MAFEALSGRSLLGYPILYYFDKIIVSSEDLNYHLGEEQVKVYKQLSPINV